MSDQAGTTDGVFWPDGEGERATLCQSLLNTVDNGIYQLDTDGRFVAVNDTFAEMTGYARDDLLGESISLVLDDNEVSSTNPLHEIVETSLDQDGDHVTLTLVSADGKQLASEHRLVSETGSIADAGGVISVVRLYEPASRNDTESMAPPDEETLAEALDEADGVGVLILDANFEVTWIDDTIERYLGVAREDVVGHDKRQLIDESIKHRFADPERFAETVLATYDEHASSEQFECHVTPGTDRDERWLEHRSNPIRSGKYAGGRIELYYDITDRKRSEDTLEETEEQFQTLVDTVEEYAIFRLDEDGHVTSWNEGAKAIKGYDREDILGEHFSTFYTDEDRAASVPARNLEGALEAGSVEDEGWRVRQDGSRFYANVTITAIWDNQGHHRGFLKVTQDMTERYERKKELEHELQQIFGRISDGFYALDEDCQFTHVNERAEAILDRDAAGLRGENIWAAFPELRNTAFDERYHEAMATQESVAFEAYYPPNDAWYEVHGYPSETGLSVYFRDVTERREREQELRRTERRFEAIFQDPNILVGLLEPDGGVLDINRTAMEYVDAELEEVIGEPFWETPWWGGRSRHPV